MPACMVATFGTYTVDETNKTLLTRVEGSIYPNNIGIEQKKSDQLSHGRRAKIY